MCSIKKICNVSSGRSVKTLQYKRTGLLKYNISNFLLQVFPIRGFILIFKKNACLLCKIIWFLFHSIAEGLPLIMKNNIIYMASTATFAGPCSIHEIFHNIFAHLGLYFVDNGTNLLVEFLKWLRSISINLIFHITPNKKVQRCE